MHKEESGPRDRHLPRPQAGEGLRDLREGTVLASPKVEWQRRCLGQSRHSKQSPEERTAGARPRPGASLGRIGVLGSEGSKVWAHTKPLWGESRTALDSAVCLEPRHWAPCRHSTTTHGTKLLTRSPSTEPFHCARLCLPTAPPFYR